MSFKSTSPFKLAIVGCGKIVQSAHLPAALSSPLVDVRGLVDLDLERANRLNRTFGTSIPTTTRLDDVLADVEGILVATGNRSHFELARSSLARGVSVLVEKPLTTRHADAEELCRIADENSAQIAVGFVTRYHPSVNQVKNLLDDGYLGKILSFEYEAGASGGWETASGYNLTREDSGGGVLVVTGTHFLDRMLYWFGYPESFSYADDSFGGVEANCKAEFAFSTPNGRFSGTIQLSKTHRLKNRVVIVTDRYRCELPDGQSEFVTLLPGDRPTLRLAVWDKSAPMEDDYFRLQIEDFARCVRHGATPVVGGRDAALSVRLVEELYARRQQLDEPWALHDTQCHV